MPLLRRLVVLFVLFPQASLAVVISGAIELAALDLQALTTNDSIANAVPLVATIDGLSGNLTRSTALAPVAYPGLFGGSGWSTSVPSTALEYLEFALEGLPGYEANVSDLYVFARLMTGLDGPPSAQIQSSVDGFSTVLASVMFEQAVVPVDVMFHVPTPTGLPPVVRMRVTAGGAATAATSFNYLAVLNSYAGGGSGGAVRVLAAPLYCVSGTHGQVVSDVHYSTLDKAALGTRLFGPYGQHMCAEHPSPPAVVGSGGGWLNAMVRCYCDCFQQPAPAYDPCDATNVQAVPYPAEAGVVCPSPGTIDSPADVAALVGCDTIVGDVDLQLDEVSLPSLRRVAGGIVVRSPTRNVSLPALTHMNGVATASVSTLTHFEADGLEDVCGGPLILTNLPALTRLYFPRLGGDSASSITMYSAVPTFYVDLGSIGGGPRRSVGHATSPPLFLQMIKQTDGLGALQVVGAGEATLYLTSCSEKTFPVSLTEARYEGRLTFVFFQCAFTVPTDVVFPRVTTLSQFVMFVCENVTTVAIPRATTVSAFAVAMNAGLVHVSLPGLVPSDTPLQIVQVYDNGPTFAELDIGSVGGGPDALDIPSTGVVTIVGDPEGRLVLRGLGSLATIRTDTNQPLQFENLAELPASVFTAEYSYVSTSRLPRLSFQNAVTTVSSVAFRISLWKSLVISNCSGIVNLTFPEVEQAETGATAVTANPDLRTVSFPAGPTAFRHPDVTGFDPVFGLSGMGPGAELTVIAFPNGTTWDPRSHHLVSLEHVVLPDLAMLNTAVYPAGAYSMIPLYLANVTVTAPGPLHLSAEALRALVVRDCIGITAVRVPEWLTVVDTDYKSWGMRIGGNAGLVEVDLGSVGGGPWMLWSNLNAPWASDMCVLCIEGSPSDMITVTGLSGLYRVYGPSSAYGVVRFRHLNDSPDLISAVGTGKWENGATGGSLHWTIEGTEWTSLALSSLTNLLEALVIRDNPNLHTFTANVGSSSFEIEDGTSIVNNPLLPDGCALDLQAKTTGLFEQSGNKAGTACP
eukprot:TRINITY_DN2113_c0_g1_i11.p1 TRINITY_DN2113_c0_g1~~TRINITY_DN2113_c0_g1_i11.p1  ORF type:complete len:1027 (-),score=268.29 TRINITY_DN2113_c0_g1_i11:413-3493(-)